uniref:Gypsy retrotransposon integrase-like protein 1 n=1 Tax=Geotrypetes seraphini TaxID=260995 RepID=A0A6P8PJB4_GEOSA|nr:uncharacterized protein LOC117354825 [Geotrypetes seraphini]
MEAAKFRTGLEGEMHRMQLHFQEMLQSQAELWKADHQAQQARHTELLQQMTAQIQAISNLAQRPAVPGAGSGDGVVGPVGAPFGEPIRLHKMNVDDDISYRTLGTEPAVSYPILKPKLLECVESDPGPYRSQSRGTRLAPKETPGALRQGLDRCFRRSGGRYQGRARVKRAGKCFACGHPGHWQVQCPVRRSLTNKVGSTTLISLREWMIPIKIEGIPLVALIDSGADQSILAQKVWQQVLRARGQKIDKPQGRLEIQCMHGTSLPYEMKEVWIEYEGRKDALKMALMPRPPYDVILGREWPYFRECCGMRGVEASPVQEEQLAQIFPLAEEVLEEPSHKRRKSRAERREDKRSCSQGKGGGSHLSWRPWVPYEVAQRFPTLSREQRKDPSLEPAIEQWEIAGEGACEFQVVGGLLYRRGWNPRAQKAQRCLVIPASFRKQIFWSIHRDRGLDHLTPGLTIKEIQRKFYWPGLVQEVVAWCKECPRCRDGGAERPPINPEEASVHKDRDQKSPPEKPEEVGQSRDQRGKSSPEKPEEVGQSKDQRGKSPPEEPEEVGQSKDQRGKSPPEKPEEVGQSKDQRGKSPLEKPEEVGQSRDQRGKSPPGQPKEVSLAKVTPDREKPILRVMRLSPKAKLPVRVTPGSVGWDLSSIQEMKVPKGGRKVVDTGVVIALPEECYGRIAPRSGLALRHGIHIGAGVVDPDYRGTLKILVLNLGEKKYSIKEGDCIAQLICERVMIPELREEVIDTVTARGEQGWGSSEEQEGVVKKSITRRVPLRLGEKTSKSVKEERTDRGLSRGVCDREAPVTVKTTTKTPQNAAQGWIKPGMESGQRAQAKEGKPRQVPAQLKSQLRKALQTTDFPYHSFPEVREKPEANLEGGGVRPRGWPYRKDQFTGEGRREETREGTRVQREENQKEWLRSQTTHVGSRSQRVPQVQQERRARSPHLGKGVTGFTKDLSAIVMMISQNSSQIIKAIAILIMNVMF